MANTRAALIAAIVGVLASTLPGLRAQEETLPVDGLVAPIEIITDHWGIAHIYAENEHDLFFAQGYNAARDRLFQFEIWRRQATGTVAEILGARELERDIGARLHRFRGDMTTEMRHYHDRGDATRSSRPLSTGSTRTSTRPSAIPTSCRWSLNCSASRQASGRRRSSSRVTTGSSPT